MVKGDFRVFEEEKLPHLKTVVTGDRIFAANDVLDFIDDEMKRRGEIIGSLGNIYAYNEIAENPLPRCVIIIDEFYVNFGVFVILYLILQSYFVLKIFILVLN